MMVCTVVSSCFKTDNRDLGVYNTDDGYITYQVNNYPYEINGGYSSFSSRGVGVYARKLLKTSSIPTTRYVVFAQLSPRQQINLIIVTDSLTTGSYKTSNSAGALSFIKIDTTQYSTNRVEDVVTLNIIRSVNGRIEGTFTGKLSEPKSDNSVITYAEGIITNGVFKNVRIGY